MPTGHGNGAVKERIGLPAPSRPLPSQGRCGPQISAIDPATRTPNRCHWDCNVTVVDAVARQLHPVVLRPVPLQPVDESSRGGQWLSHWPVVWLAGLVLWLWCRRCLGRLVVVVVSYCCYRAQLLVEVRMIVNSFGPSLRTYPVPPSPIARRTLGISCERPIRSTLVSFISLFGGIPPHWIARARVGSVAVPPNPPDRDGVHSLDLTPHDGLNLAADCMRKGTKVQTTCLPTQ